MLRVHRPGSDTDVANCPSGDKTRSTDPLLVSVAVWVAGACVVVGAAGAVVTDGAAVVDVVGAGALVVSEATDPDVVGVLVVDSPPPQADKNNKTAANPTRNLIEPNYARSLGRSRGVGFAQTVLKDFAELVLWHLVNEFDATRHLVSPYQAAAMFDDCFGAQSLFGLNDDHCRDKLT